RRRCGRTGQSAQCRIDRPGALRAAPDRPQCQLGGLDREPAGAARHGFHRRRRRPPGRRGQRAGTVEGPGDRGPTDLEVIRLLTALVAVLWLSGCGGEPAHEWPEPSPALWEVSNPQGAKGWLFGTIHALPDGANWRTPTLDTALEQADLLVVEVSNLGDAEMASQAFTAFAAGRGLPPLMDRVPPEHRPALAAALERAAIDESDLAATDSWAAALLIANATRAGSAANGVDRALLSLDLPAIALESYPMQFSIFDRLEPEEQQI